MPYFYHPESCCVWEAAEHYDDELVIEIDYERYLKLKQEFEPMAEDKTRELALSLAVQSGGVNTDTPTIVQRAGAFAAFLAEGTVPEKKGGRKAADKQSESPAAGAADTSSASTAKTAAAETSTSSASSDDDFLSESPPSEPEKKYELKDVREALVSLQTAVSKEVAMSVLKDVGGAEQLGGLKPEKFAAVVKAANERKAKGK